MEKGVGVEVFTSDPVVGFAADELRKYLVKMGNAVKGSDGEEGLKLGMFENFTAGYKPWPAVSEADDAIYIETSGAEGVIAGSNPRSVLLAVYRYLTELGCRWVRPGPDGEFIPPVALSSTSVHMSEAASYGHRGICIEGAVSFQHVRGIIDWSPKVGLNTYFTQFREAYTFFDRWYSHRENPLKQPEPFSIEKARELKVLVADEIKKRGMAFHDVGHGWTCEPFGIPGLGWDNYEEDVPAEAAQYLAEVNGERKFWYKVPLNTNLCYSNPKVRQIMLDDIVKYSRIHPEVDVLHFWLADGVNNHCECTECVKATPSDWYVLMLNELDGLLTQAGLGTRIVFLIYVDLMWPPVTGKLINPERFILMFAPITRTYTNEFAPSTSLPDLPPFNLNKLEFPKGVDANIAFLRAWQRLFKGDSFDFDYHFMWDHYKDPGYYAIAETLYKDVRALKDLQLNGLVSCQVQRAFFPSGLGMMVMARTLWNRDLKFEDMVNDYFHSAFGADGSLVADYLQELSCLFDPPYIRGERERINPENAAAYAKIPEVINAFRSVIHRNLSLADECHRQSWRYLDVHADMSSRMAEVFRLRAEGKIDESIAAWEPVKQIARENEDELFYGLDVFEYILIMDRLVRG